MTKEEWYNQLFLGLGRSKFRSSFHLKQKDIDYINEKGLDTIREHAREFIAKTDTNERTSGFCGTARNGNMLQGVHQKVAQNTTWKRAKPDTTGIFGGCDNDVD